MFQVDSESRACKKLKVNVMECTKGGKLQCEKVWIALQGTICRSSSRAEDQGVERGWSSCGQYTRWGLDHGIITLPHITSIINDWLCRFPRFSTASHSSGQHYQLSGDIALRSTRNALKLRDSIQLHCEGNPFIVGAPLKSIVSSVLIPEAAKEDILHRDEKGLDGYQ